MKSCQPVVPPLVSRRWCMECFGHGRHCQCMVSLYSQSLQWKRPGSVGLRWQLGMACTRQTGSCHHLSCDSRANQPGGFIHWPEKDIVLDKPRQWCCSHERGPECIAFDHLIQHKASASDLGSNFSTPVMLSKVHPTHDYKKVRLDFGDSNAWVWTWWSKSKSWELVSRRQLSMDV